MHFNFYETSLNIQNGGTHSTNVKIFNCLYVQQDLTSTLPSKQFPMRDTPVVYIGWIVPPYTTHPQYKFSNLR